MSTSANTPVPEEPPPKSILNIADLAQRSFANVTKRQNSYLTFHSPIMMDCANKYGSFCRNAFFPVKPFPRIQNFPMISMPRFLQSGITIYKLNVF